MSEILSYHGLSDKGLIRKYNEDYFAFVSLDPTNNDSPNMAIVTDGMGGAQAGDVASKLAVNYVKERMSSDVLPTLPSKIEAYLLEVILSAHHTIRNHGEKESAQSGMGTTIAILYIENNIAYIAWSGDSRIYLHSEKNYCKIGSKISKQFRLLSSDHSLVWKDYQEGRISLDQLDTHEMGHIITQSLGAKNDPVPEVLHFEIKQNSKFLLCSDGLNNAVDSTQIESIVASQNDDAEIITQNLIDAALTGGGRDNITALILDVKVDKVEGSILSAITQPIEKKIEKGINPSKWKPMLVGSVLVLLLAALYKWMPSTTDKEVNNVNKLVQINTDSIEKANKKKEDIVDQDSSKKKKVQTRKNKITKSNNKKSSKKKPVKKTSKKVKKSTSAEEGMVFEKIISIPDTIDTISMKKQQTSNLDYFNKFLIDMRTSVDKVIERIDRVEEKNIVLSLEKSKLKDHRNAWLQLKNNINDLMKKTEQLAPEEILKNIESIKCKKGILEKDLDYYFDLKNFKM